MKYEKRADVPERYTWNKSDIFATPEEWERAVAGFSGVFAAIEGFRGKLKDKETILRFYKLLDEKTLELEKIYCYTHLEYDEDTKNTEAQERIGKAQNLFVRLKQSLSFVDPEMSALSDSFINEMINDPEFADFDITLKYILRNKPHILSEEGESLLAGAGDFSGGFSTAFNRMDNGDIKYGTINIRGEKVSLSHGTYSVLMQDKDQKIRAKAFKQYYKSYIDVVNTLSSLYESNVKKDWYFARSRKFGSTMESALFYEEVDKKVYTNLIKSVHKSLKPLHEYVGLRKKLLGLKTLNMYDMYVPAFEDVEYKLDFEDAFELVKKGLAPLGEDYIALLDRAKNERWMDVYETPGKRSGAYSMGISGVHPFVLLNYQETLNDISTIAHELGHAMHSYYSEKGQCYNKSGYKIFVAEVASTCNEILLHKYITANTDDIKVKKYLITVYLDMLRTTMYRQTMFAEFESISHEMVEKGQTLTYENLCAEYLKLNKKYYGRHVKHNKEISYEWCRVPHFYRAFYVYKYATGIISAVCIAEKILKEGEPAVKKYKEFLSLGGSMDPVSELKVAGVDLTTSTPFEIVNKSFEDALEQLKSLCD